MKATPDQKKLWKEWFEHGDLKKIAIEYGFHRITIGETFHTGIGTEQIISAINSFYKERIARVQAEAKELSKEAKR